MMPPVGLVNPALRAKVPPEDTLIVPLLVKLVALAFSVPVLAPSAPSLIKMLGLTAKVWFAVLATMLPLLVMVAALLW